MAKKKQSKISKTRNLAAAQSRNMSGAGQHQDKTGENASRIRQKRQWKKDIHEKTLIGQANTMLAYDNSDDFNQALKDIEQQFDINLSEGFSPQQMADMDKLIQEYGESFFRDGAAEDIGNDLEMLEYSPDEVEVMIPHIMSQVEQMWQSQGK